MSVVRKRGGIYGGYDKKTWKEKTKKLQSLVCIILWILHCLLFLSKQIAKKKQANKQNCREQRSINIVKGMFKDSITYTNKIASEMIKIKLSKLVSKLMNAI